MEGLGSRQQCLQSVPELSELNADSTEDKHNPTAELKVTPKINNPYFPDDCHHHQLPTTTVIAFGWIIYMWYIQVALWIIHQLPSLERTRKYLQQFQQWWMRPFRWVSKIKEWNNMGVWGTPCEWIVLAAIQRVPLAEPVKTQIAARLIVMLGSAPELGFVCRVQKRGNEIVT